MPTPSQPLQWVFDLDGVIWLAGQAIPGSPEAVARLRAAGHRMAFVTNNSGPTVAQYLASLTSAGVEASADELVTSAQAAAAMVPAGTRVTVVGGDGITEALGERGAHVVAVDEDPAVVVVGRTVVLDHDQLAAAATAVRRGARFIATNTDSTFPTGTALLPGAGALVAFVATASGVSPEVAGKPQQPVADLVKARFGQPAVMVGDRPDTDGLFAQAVGARFALVLSGVTRPDDLPVTPAPDLLGPDLAAIVDQVLNP